MAYNPQTDFMAALQRAQGNTGYENYGREYFDPVSGMNFVRGGAGTGAQWASNWANSGDNTGGGGMTAAMTGVGQGDYWRAYDGAAGREASDNFALNGLPYHMYGQDGSYSGQDVWKDLEKNTIMEQLLPIGMLAAPFALTMMGAGGAAGAAGAGAGSGAGAGGIGAAAGDAGLMYAGADAAAAGSLGTGTLTGAQVLSGAALPAAASGGGSILSKIGSALGLGGGAGGGAGGFDWTSLVGPAISAAGGIYGANQAGKAADSQLQAAREAMALNEPFRQGGIKGMNRLLDLLGVSGNTGAEGYGSAAKSFGADDFQADAGYQFRQDEGQKALERRLSAGGSLYSGKALKDSMRFNQGEASQEYGNAFNRFQVERQAKLNPLQSLMGAGQTAANTVADYRTQAGNAQAAGIVGKANALTGAIGQGVSMYQNQQQQNSNNALLQRILGGAF